MKRYIEVPIVKVGNKIYPIWDNRLDYNKSDDYGVYLTMNSDDVGSNRNIYDLSVGIYDLKTKKLSAGIILNYRSKPIANINDDILVECDHSTYRIDKIVDIIYDRYESIITSGSNLKHYKSLTDADGNEFIDINDKTNYNLREYKPTYILSDGSKVEWEYKIKKLKR